MMHTRNLPSLCHAKSCGDDERGIAILGEVLQGSAESDSGAADNCFTTTVNASEGSKVEFPDEVVALLEVACDFSEQEVGCERDLDCLNARLNHSQTYETWSAINHKPVPRSNEGIARDQREWQTRERAAAKHHIRVV